MVTDLKFNEFTDLGKGIYDSFKKVHETISSLLISSEGSSGFCMFASWDIVDSSLFKSTRRNWAQKINEVLKIAVNTVNEEYDAGFTVWRIIGDEVVAFKVLQNLSDIESSVESICRISNKIKRSIEERKIGVLFKTAAWIAHVSDNDQSESDYESYLSRITTGGNQRIIDFMGEDIDAGFRIAKFSQPNVLTIFFELSCFLMDANYMGTLWIAKFERLKGLYGEKPYPIIWHPLDDHKGITISESVPYHYDFFNSETAYCFRNLGLDSDGFAEYDKTISSMICNGLKLEEKMELWRKKWNAKESIPIKAMINTYQELHCVAICYAKDTKKILVMKRSSNHARFPLYWEFGCVHPNSSQSIADALKVGYKTKYGLDIEFLYDNIAHDPKPFLLYEIQDEDTECIHNGIRFIATVEQECNPVYDQDKYIDYKWIEESDVDNFLAESGDVIQNMKEIINEAFKYMENYSDEFK